MREYYTRVFAEWIQDIFRFSKGQLLVSLVAGVGAAFVSGTLGTIDRALVWKSALVSVICYAAIFLARAWWASIVAPVTLDKRRQSALDELGQQKAMELVDLNRSHAAEATAINDTLAKCREQLARKHPFDEAKEQHVRDSLKNFTVEDTGALRWLLHNGETHELDIPREIPTFQIAMGKAMQTSPPLVQRRLSADINRRRAGRDLTIYQVSPGYEEALKNVLHPFGQASSSLISQM